MDDAEMSEAEMGDDTPAGSTHAGSSGEEAASRPPGSTGRYTRAVAIALGVAFVGLMVFSAVRLLGSRGGSDSPGGAVRAFAQALSEEDIVGALGLLSPSDVATLPDLYPKLARFAEHEDIVERVDWLRDVDIDISGLEIRTTQLHADVAVVELLEGRLSADVGAGADSGAFGDVEKRRYSTTVSGLQRELAMAASDWDDAVPWQTRAPRHVFVVTVRQGGVWYVSPYYTVVEIARQILDLPDADFTASRERAEPGAASAAGVIGDLVEVVNSRSLDEHYADLTAEERSAASAPLNALVSPAEFGPLLDYWPSYLTLAERLADERVLNDNPTLARMLEADDFEVDGRLRLRVDTRNEARPDGSVAVYLESGSATVSGSASIGDETFAFDVDAAWDGLCGEGYAYVEDAFSEQFDGCADPTPDDWYHEIDAIYVIVNEHDGTWYANWLATLLSYLEVYLDHRLADS